MLVKFYILSFRIPFNDPLFYNTSMIFKQLGPYGPRTLFKSYKYIIYYIEISDTLTMSTYNTYLKEINNNT